MHAFHERLARVGLAVLSDYGFALAGGYAVQAHGLVSRPSEDVDLFTTMDAEATFPTAVAAAIAAYQQDGLSVEVLLQSPRFARLSVADPDQRLSAKVELGIDWRQHAPTTLAIGPVLDRDDAVANKVNALYSRAQARDYIDVHAALASGRYTGPDLLRLAGEHDPGFAVMFAQALRAIRRHDRSRHVAAAAQRRPRAHGQGGPGRDRLPSENGLASTYGCSRGTIRRALVELEAAALPRAPPLGAPARSASSCRVARSGPRRQRRAARCECHRP